MKMKKLKITLGVLIVLAVYVFGISFICKTFKTAGAEVIAMDSEKTTNYDRHKHDHDNSVLHTHKNQGIYCPRHSH